MDIGIVVRNETTGSQIEKGNQICFCNVILLNVILLIFPKFLKGLSSLFPSLESFPE